MINPIFFQPYPNVNLLSAPYSGGAYGNWNGMSIAGNVLSPIGAPQNAWSYRANVTAGKYYRVTSPQPAVAGSGGWSITICWSANGTTLSGTILYLPISATNFYWLAPATATSMEIAINRNSTSGGSDTCTFYGFKMVAI